MPAGTSKPWRLLREPTVHFFALAAVLLVGQKLVTGDPRTIRIPPALKADLLRRYHDQMGRAPTSAEAEAFMKAWKSDEALYREALREGIDRDDPTVRNVLIAKMRDRLLLELRRPEPSEAELQRYLEQHRDELATPLIYEHELVAFPKSDPEASRKRAESEAKLTAGATTAALGLRSTAANVSRERIEQEFGPEVAGAIVRLPIGRWQELETGDRLLLVRMIGVQGGLPEPRVLHERLLAAWQAAADQQALARAARQVEERYHFEERAP